MGYSKLVAWEVYNFMSYDHGKVQFDDSNIINIKGYNDSGKSAMLTALRVLMSNSNASKQVNFIKDDKDYFRIVAYFEDGVIILRDKYRNGASLYEMYKNDNLIFTTKQGNALTKVDSVPEPIAQYLGLIGYEKSFLNFRSCFEPLLGVDTKGSENYKMFNTVLKAEELARAGEMLNADKNKLNNQISETESEISANKAILGRGKYITEDMDTALGDLDNRVTVDEARKTAVLGIKNNLREVQGIKIAPELNNIDTKRLTAVLGIKNNLREVQGIKIAPELNAVDTARINELKLIRGLVSQTVQIAPELSKIDTGKITKLEQLQGIVSQMKALDSEISDIDSQIKACSESLDDLGKQAKASGYHIVKCPHCGSMFDANEEGGVADER